MTYLRRKIKFFCLSLRISRLKRAMERERGVTDQFRILAREFTALCVERNNLRTAQELRQIEKKRGLA